MCGCIAGRAGHDRPAAYVLHTLGEQGVAGLILQHAGFDFFHWKVCQYRIKADDILDIVPVSRRQLERKFREHLGRSPLQEIRRAHLNKAKALLVGTDATLQEIADRSGFGNMYHLCRIFKRETGDTPITYRRKQRFG